jgi:hypothetical protein
MLTTLISLGLDYKIDEKNYIDSLQYETYGAVDREINDIAGNYLVTKSYIDNYISQISHELTSFNNISIKDEYYISASVVDSATKIINNLSPITCSKLEIYNIYPSNYGTIIFEWENIDNIFTLEIGKDSIGYFIEEGEVFTEIVESSSLIDDNYSKTLLELTTILNNFYS